MTNVVDSDARVEQADGSAAGERSEEYIEGTTARFTSPIVVAELADRSTRTERRSGWTEHLLPSIRRHTTVVPLDTDLADRAGEATWAMRESSPAAGLADATVLATARAHDARVVTGDPDFLVPALADEGMTAARRPGDRNPDMVVENEYRVRVTDLAVAPEVSQ